MLPNDSQVAKMVEQPFAMLDLLDNSEEMEVYQETKEALSEADGVVSLLDGHDVLDDEMIVTLESRFPGLVLDNVPYDIRYSTEGMDTVKKTAKDIQQRMLAASSVATIAMIDNFAGFLRNLAGTNVNDGVVSCLLSIDGARKTLKQTSAVSNDDTLINAYQSLMGLKPESKDQVIEMIQVIKSSDSGLECLKKFPNDKYDRIFTPLLASTVAESSKIFSCFDLLNRTYARQLIETIDKVKSDLTKIMEAGDYDQMGVYQGDLIPEEIMRTMTEIVGSLDVELDHRKGILKQTRAVSKHMAKMLKANEDSLRKKASVVNAIVHRHKELDKAFKDISEATIKLANYTKSKDVDLKSLRVQMRKFRYAKHKGGLLYRKGLRSGQNHHRILNELDDVWSLVDLMVRMCISFTTAYSVLKITLDKFRKNFADFVSTVNELTTSEGEVSSDDESSPETSNDEDQEEKQDDQ